MSSALIGLPTLLRSLSAPRWAGPPRERVAYALGDLNIPSAGRTLPLRTNRRRPFRALYQFRDCQHVLTEDAVHAARLVTSRANIVLLNSSCHEAAAAIQVVDSSIVQQILAHVPLRDAAVALGLDKSAPTCLADLTTPCGNCRNVGNFRLDIALPRPVQVAPRLKPQKSIPLCVILRLKE